MTKADRIRELAANGYSVAAICELVGTTSAYVRTAVRQRVGGSMSAGDLKYMSNPSVKARHREKARECMRRLRQARADKAASEP